MLWNFSLGFVFWVFIEICTRINTKSMNRIRFFRGRVLKLQHLKLVTIVNWRMKILYVNFYTDLDVFTIFCYFRSILIFYVDFCDFCFFLISSFFSILFGVLFHFDLFEIFYESFLFFAMNFTRAHKWFSIQTPMFWTAQIWIILNDCIS